MVTHQLANYEIAGRVSRFCAKIHTIVDTLVLTSLPVCSNLYATDMQAGSVTPAPSVQTDNATGSATDAYADKIQSDAVRTVTCFNVFPLSR